MSNNKNKIRLNWDIKAKEVYDYMKKLTFPFGYATDFNTWENSYLRDVDGQSRTLFSELATIGAYMGNELIGFIQYGKTAFGFGDNGEVTDRVSYPVIRNLYFCEESKEAGEELLDKAIKALSDDTNTIYAFFHYFGMSCYARHGKLFEKFGHIHNLLEKSNFTIEHENVFYSIELRGAEITLANSSGVTLGWHDMTPGRQRYCDFILGKELVGGCEIHFLEQEQIAYLRWIFINENMCSKGIGSECMSVLKADLLNKGIKRFDTDTALTNEAAQHFYEKNCFVREGLTRSYQLFN